MYWFTYKLIFNLFNFNLHVYLVVCLLVVYALLIDCFSFLFQMKMSFLLNIDGQMSRANFRYYLWEAREKEREGERERASVPSFFT